MKEGRTERGRRKEEKVESKETQAKSNLTIHKVEEVKKTHTTPSHFSSLFSPAFLT